MCCETEINYECMLASCTYGLLSYPGGNTSIYIFNLINMFVIEYNIVCFNINNISKNRKKKTSIFNSRHKKLLHGKRRAAIRRILST